MNTGRTTPIPFNPEEELALLRREAAALQVRAEFLEDENRLLRAILYGRSSEKKPRIEESSNQLHFSFDEAETKPPSPEIQKIKIGEHSRQKPGRKPITPTLPRVEKIIDLPESEKVAPCGCPLKCIGKEESERLDIVPAKIRVEKTIRLKYAPGCMCATGVGAEGEVRIAPTPAELIPHGNATAGLVAHVVTAKFVDGIPLYRQEQQFIRLGLDIKRNTLCSWVLLAAAACMRLLEFLMEEILAGSVINMDETRVQVLGEPGRANTTNSFMWVMRGGPPDRPGVIFRYDPSRAAKIPEEMLRGYRGFLQTDGYIGYEAIGEREGIRHLGCWAHARRKFVDVVKGTKGYTKAGVAQEIIDLIAKLYAVEAKADEQKSSANERKTLRNLEAKPVLEQIKEILDNRKKTTPPRSLLGKAIAYSLNQWPRLEVYLENGNLRPDNNLAENAIRPFAVGRRNWLFSGSPRGAVGSAALYSLIETAKANSLEPYKYLRFIFTELPKASSDGEIRSLLPQYLDRSRLEGF